MGRAKIRPPTAAAATDNGGGVGDGCTDLKALIHEHALFFDQLVELIPARFFLSYSADDKPWFPGLSKAEKQKLKAQTRENIVKSRRDRLDPTQFSSTLDLLKKSLADEQASSDEDDDDEEEEEEEEEEDDEEEEEEEEEGEEKVEKKVAGTGGEQPVTYEELQERLRRRIAELAAGRNTRPESRLKQEKKKELKNKKKTKVDSKKNREKNKDGEASSSASGKRKREDGNDNDSFSKGKNKKKNKVGEVADITFGQVKIDGKDGKKRKKKLPKEKELERARKLEEIKKDPEKGKKVSWKAAVSKAAGEKVHDDPKLLKQSIKKEKKRQQKNAEKWKERERTVRKARAEKQSKRSENISERIHQKKMRKIEKREKKLMRPGFEGRKEGYMNE